MRYCFDIDGTICSTNCEYKDSVPYQEVIDWINKKYDEGHSITLFTSRGTSSGLDWIEFTEKQVDGWGIYLLMTELSIMKSGINKKV